MPEDNQHIHIAIIGNGVSGITAARTLRKSDRHCRITVISSETKYFFSRTALMYIYMGHMTFEHTKPYEDHFWEKNRIDLLFDHVVKVDSDSSSLHLKSGGVFKYDKLLIASGSKSNKFGWPGQDLKGVQGLYSYQDLQLLEQNTHPSGTSNSVVKHAVIVGGGLIGVELAEMLITRNVKVSFLVRENRFWGNVLPKDEGDFIGNHLKDHGVNLLLEEELEEIIPDAEGRVRSIKTKSGKEIECQFVGLTVGVSPNIEFLKDSKIELNRGVIVNSNLETNIPGVYAAGDCAEFKIPPTGRRNIEQVWYTGRMMGEVVAKNILGKKTEYDPGPWFNSAKFFDIEYQTYGKVSNAHADDETAFYWESSDRKQCLKIVYDKGNEQVKGLNVFGIRLRHELMDRWLRKDINVTSLLSNFRQLNFDPEFYKDYSEDIIQAFNKSSGKNLKVQKKSWKEIFLNT